MEIAVKYESLEDKTWHEAQQTLKRSYEPLGFSKETISRALTKFEPFWKKYAGRKIEINMPKEQVEEQVNKQFLKQVTAQVHDLNSQMLFDIAGLCLQIEL